MASIVLSLLLPGFGIAATLEEDVQRLEEALKTTTERKICNGAASGLKYYGSQGRDIIRKHQFRSNEDGPETR
jgi:hypothetical protein